MQKRKPIPSILPREPLTKKAKAGIYTYVEHHEKNKMFMIGVVTRTLEAERMKRDALYEWLKNHDYYWIPNTSFWRHKSQDN